MTTAVSVATAPFTYQDYLRLPDSPYREEVLGGELIVSPSPSVWHQHVVARLDRALGGEVERRELGLLIPGPVDVVFTHTEVVVPDLVFVSRERADIIQDAGVFGAPDLVVEVVSKWSGVRDTRDKYALYARQGVAHYWLFDPEQRRAWFFELADDEYRLVGEHSHETVRMAPFTDLELNVGTIWPAESAAT